MSTSAHLVLTAEDKTQAAFRSLHQTIQGTVDRLGGLKNKLLAVAGVDAFWHLVEPAIEAGAEIEKLSHTLGASTESLSQFKHVAELSHVSFESLTKGWRLMEKNVSLAAQGTGTAKAALDALGLSATALKKLKPEDQFAVLADAMATVQNPADKVRMAMQILGRAGADLIPLMEGGAKAMAAAREEADHLGLTLNETSTHQFAQAHEAIVRLDSAWAGAKNTLAMAFAPVLAKVADGLGFILPQAANLTARAFLFIEKIVTFALARITIAIDKILGLLGKLPGAIGQSCREAAAATELFTQRWLANGLHCEQTLASLTHAQQAYQQQVKRTGQTLTTVYHPALQALSEQQKKARSSLLLLTESEKSDQNQFERGKALTQQMRTPQEIYRDQLKAINQLLQAGTITHQTYTRAIQQYQTQLTQTNGASTLLADQKKKTQAQINTIANCFRNGLFAYVEGGFNTMIKSFEQALSAMAADYATSEISQFLGGGLGRSAMKSGSGLLGQWLTKGFGQLFGGFRADGGPVFPGSSYIVGERGAEVFIPHQSGHIIPHESLNRPQNLPPMVMHIHTPDAHSFRLSRHQIAHDMGVALQRAWHRR